MGCVQGRHVHVGTVTNVFYRARFSYSHTNNSISATNATHNSERRRVQEVALWVKRVINRPAWADGVRAVKALVIWERGAGYKVP